MRCAGTIRGRSARVVAPVAASHGTDLALALELLVAPLHFRTLLIRQPLDDSLIERVVDTLLRGLAA